MWQTEIILSNQRMFLNITEFDFLRKHVKKYLKVLARKNCEKNFTKKINIINHIFGKMASSLSLKQDFHADRQPKFHKWIKKLPF